MSPLSGSPPEQNVLLSSYPNPFNPHARIRVSLPSAREVDLRLFDILGREVCRIFTGRGEAGETYLDFDGSGLASGTYFARVQTSAGSAAERLTLIK